LLNWNLRIYLFLRDSLLLLRTFQMQLLRISESFWFLKKKMVKRNYMMTNLSSEQIMVYKAVIVRELAFSFFSCWLRSLSNLDNPHALQNLKSMSLATVQLEHDIWGHHIFFMKNSYNKKENKHAKMSIMTIYNKL
jgi:hypothetical protein